MKFKKHLGIIMSFAMIFSASTSSFAANDQIIESIFSDPITFNPILASDAPSYNVIYKCFDGLYKRDWNMKIVPATASALPKIENKGLKITIPLRKDVKWHDGKPFTSSDVKFSIEMIQNKSSASPRKSLFELIESVSTPDPYTVVLNMTSVDAGLLNTLTGPYIMPEHIFKDISPSEFKQSEYSRSKVIGNGPWKFVEWKTSERIVVEANPNYYGTKPKIKKYILTITPSQAVAMVRAETGESQVVSVPESDIARMQKNTRLNVNLYSTTAFDCIVYNHKTEFFSDKKVRQAFTYAINKNVIIRGIYKGIGTVANTSFHPKFTAYNNNIKVYDYNVVKAKALLDEAGWKMGSQGIRVKNGKEFKMTLLTNKGNIMREKLTVELQRQLKPLGIAVEPRILEWNTFLQKYIDPGKFDAYIGGFSPAIDGDPITYYHSDRSKSPFNKGSYNNPIVDKLLLEGRGTYNSDEQKKIYGKLQEIIVDEQPMTFLVFKKTAYAISKRVQGVKVVDLLGINNDYSSWTITD